MNASTGSFSTHNSAGIGTVTGLPTNLVTDGTNVYGACSVTSAGRFWSIWSISGLTMTTSSLPNGFNAGVALTTSGHAVLAASQGSSGPPETEGVTLPGTVASPVQYTSYTHEFSGNPIYDGTYIWVPLNGTTTLLQITAASPSTYVPHTMPGSAAGTVGIQNGFDGRYLYIPYSGTAGAGICVWDTTTNTGATYATVASVTMKCCYFSANTTLVYLADDAGNIYTMAAGGGTPTLIGNVVTLGAAPLSNCFGFCDGPAGNDVWATSVSYNFKWVPATVNQSVMVV
jgi:hypothetical protein